MPAFERPQYHITRATDGPAAEVQAGDTIWLVGQLFSPWGNLPPAIDARIEVAEVIKRYDGKGYRYTAGDDSRWFPLADASRVLRCKSLETVTVTGKKQPLWASWQHKPIGHSLQRMRRLSSGHLLNRWEKVLDRRSVGFISYRLCDGTCAAFRVVRSKIHSGEPMFWDRWSLPRRIAEGREFVNDEKLEAFLREQIGSATTVCGICSPLYSEVGSYSRREKEYAESLGKYVAYAQPNHFPVEEE